MTGIQGEASTPSFLSQLLLFRLCICLLQNSPSFSVPYILHQVLLSTAGYSRCLYSALRSSVSGGCITTKDKHLLSSALRLAVTITLQDVPEWMAQFLYWHKLKVILKSLVLAAKPDCQSWLLVQRGATTPRHCRSHRHSSFPTLS